MRIISGTARGTKLKSVDDPALRPMLDRVKDPLFNILRHLTSGAHVLDLYSGSGALGIETLSRGAVRCVFVEKDPRLVRLIEVNAERCHVTDRCKVLQAAVDTLPRRPPPRPAADMVFVDPPYALVDDPNERAALFATLEALLGSWIGADAVLVLHHRPMRHALWPTERFSEWDQRVYGRSQLTFFEVAGEGGSD